MPPKPYRFTIHDGPGVPPRVAFGQFSDAAEARVHADTLLAEGPSLRSVAVADGYEEAFVVEAPMSVDDWLARAALAHHEANAAMDDTLREQWRSVARSWERLAEHGRRR